MDCTITSTARDKIGRSGFTLVEVVVSIGISIIVLAAVMSFYIFTGWSSLTMGNYIALDMKSRNALDTMSCDIRQANSCSTNAFSSTNLTLSMTDPATSSAYTINYAYNAGLGRVVRTETRTNSIATMLLSNCTSFAFTYFQRNPSNGAWGAFSNDLNRADQCKLVQIDWTCSLPGALGRMTNSESMESARVVIRKE
jgi:type II secretory pathway component PulJ